MPSVDHTLDRRLMSSVGSEAQAVSLGDPQHRNRDTDVVFVSPFPDDALWGRSEGKQYGLALCRLGDGQAWRGFQGTAAAGAEGRLLQGAYSEV